MTMRGVFSNTGTAGQVLTSNGGDAEPTFQAVASSPDHFFAYAYMQSNGAKKAGYPSKNIASGSVNGSNHYLLNFTTGWSAGGVGGIPIIMPHNATDKTQKRSIMWQWNSATQLEIWFTDGTFTFVDQDYNIAVLQN